MPTLAEAKEKVRELSTKALATVEDTNLTNEEKKTILDKLEPDIKKWEDEVGTLDRFEETKKKYGNGLEDGAVAGGDGVDHQGQPVKAKSLGRQFIEHPAYKALGPISGKSGSWQSDAIELKTTLSEAVGGADLVATPIVLPGIVDLRFQPTTVFDLIPDGTTDSPLLRYLVEVAVTNAAAAVAEAGLYPESALTFAKVDESLKKIATFLPVTDEMLEDFEQIASYIDARLQLFVNLQNEVQVLRGDGTGNNLVGLLNRAGLAATIHKGTAPSVAGDNDMDAIYRQITQIRTTSFLEPDAVAIDPNAWQTIQLSKNAQGQYYAGGPFLASDNANGGQTGSLWGKKVVATTSMPASTALVGAFAQACQKFRKGGITVVASNSHSDFFIRGETAIRADNRLLLAVYRPGAFGIVDTL
jgi:HK97 family phage major capsid protein